MGRAHYDSHVAQQAEALLIELTDVLGALTASQEVLVSRLQRIRLEGIASVPSAAGFVPPVEPARVSTTLATGVIEVQLQRVTPVPPVANDAPTIEPITAPTMIAPEVTEVDRMQSVTIVSERPVEWPSPLADDPSARAPGAREYDYFADLDAKLARLAESKRGEHQSN